MTQAEDQPTPSRTFQITPKHAYTDLGFPPGLTGHEYVAMFATHTVTANITYDLYGNAAELQAGVPLRDIETAPDYTYTHQGQRLTGQHALRREFASTLASLAVGLQWNLDRPEFVYMSGYIYETAYRAGAMNINNQIERRKLTIAPTPEIETAKQTQIAEMTARMAQYNTFAMRLREARAAYAQQYLPHSSQYLEVLQALPHIARNPNFAKKSGKWGNREKLFTALLQRDEQGFVSEKGIQQAHDLLYQNQTS